MVEERSFNHPYKPYEIQKDLMERIYALLEGGKKVGIFESPTGTGKTLSLICPSVTWLRENKARILKSSSNSSRETQVSGDDDDDSDDSDEPEWVRQAYEKSVSGRELHALEEYERYLSSRKITYPTRNEDLRVSQGPLSHKKRKVKRVEVNFEDADFLPEEQSDNAITHPTTGAVDTAREKLGDEVKALLSKLDGHENAAESFNLTSPIKIFFTSRTHSQLSQFAAQLRLPHFPPSISTLETERIKFLALGSRKQLCINPKVSKSRDQSINDCCLDAIKNQNCEFYTKARDSHYVEEFRDAAFSQVSDIEELATIGESMGVCPYYASREVVNQGVEIVTLPYQHLLVEETRQALGIDLKDSIVILDEAHNVIDTINSVNSSEVSRADLMCCKNGLQVYTNKFRSRLGAKSRVNLMKLMKLIDVLITFLHTHYKNGSRFASSDIFDGTNADMLNIHQLNTYMKTSKIAYKIDNYTQSLQELNRESAKVQGQPTLFKVAKFLTALANPSLEGELFFEKDHVMKYMLLEPGSAFKSVVEEAKCVLFAGGTLQPVSRIFRELLPSVPSQEIETFSCNHVIPPQNLSTYIVKESFDFTFDKRESATLLRELASFFKSLALRVPDGIVAFFPSYAYLSKVVDFWKKQMLVTERIEGKRIFFETSDSSQVLNEYISEVETSGKGAILFAVVGGRLSEGINFKDALARAVVMVGLPFPNLFSGELIIKRKHLEKKIMDNGGTRNDALAATREMYEDICMTAVNQSVGRAIRHIGDYATIYLLDKRYDSSRILDKLSRWVRSRLSPNMNINAVLEDTEKFFSNKIL
ncbi:LAMI_0F12750g1_1 [Lachancea mirantina]|uniref:ATP-dependent DNA helicase CHL1 n=1 Tax=Lachancea mirantina TaxID=1230905 RepID=A0A1G4K333_9SACH|nr:LAMI_0F12750g1_1 [Lachancea mirantina]